MMTRKKFKIAIIGLGYVGLPLAIEFGKKINTYGYDINKKRIQKLKNNIDETKEVSESNFKLSKKLFFENNINKLKNCNVFIVTVPTPIKKNYKPDLKFIRNACNDISKILKKEDLVIFESTVYPGITNDFCGRLIEKRSKLVLNKDFYLGYSPERINPGDKRHTIKDIVKIVSGSNKKALRICELLYGKILKLRIHKTSSIEIAEAAKVIENTQRDINIAFMNELSLIFDNLDINTNEVLNAAKTKWNFNHYTPGLVGGHCIGVDPYYLAHVAKLNNYKPKLILAGRNLNESMAKEVVKKTFRLMINKDIKIEKPKILILGLSFKENCTDIRNSKSFNIIDIFLRKKIKVDIYDPIANLEKIEKKYLSLIKKPKNNYYDCIILLVKHNYFINKIGFKKIAKLGKKKSIFFDIKGAFNRNLTDYSL